MIKVTSLFSGIGGLEKGFKSTSHQISLLCEIDPAAQLVLKKQFPETNLVSDITTLKELPPSNIITAGFPCQDLSQAGKKAGISGSRSGLVSHLFRLIKKADKNLDWLIIENVPYMLSLNQGEAMKFLADSLSEMGFTWAYRTVDARCFGLPQRRPRIVLLASRKHDPRPILLGKSEEVVNLDGIPLTTDEEAAYGFYWTEGKRGVGWTKNGVPPIKGGSSIGIPSPPAVWIPSQDYFGTISLTDAERLQGFRKGWTSPATKVPKMKNARWKLVGNAVNTRMSVWLSERISLSSSVFIEKPSRRIDGRWPKAAWGNRDGYYASDATTWPKGIKCVPILDFLLEPLKTLSHRATSGFHSRALQCTNVVYSERFLTSLEKHIANHDSGKFTQ